MEHCIGGYLNIQDGVRACVRLGLIHQGWAGTIHNARSGYPFTVIHWEGFVVIHNHIPMGWLRVLARKRRWGSADFIHRGSGIGSFK